MAKPVFIKQANLLSITEHEDFKKLTCDARSVGETNYGDGAGLVAVKESNADEEDEVKLDEQEEADLVKTINDSLMN